MAFRLNISGRRACFRRVECADFITYDVITPLAAKSIFEAVYWTPIIRWKIDEIRVLNPVRSAWTTVDGANTSQDSNENYSTKEQLAVSRAHILTDVSYLVTAHFDIVQDVGASDASGQHTAMFRRRLRQGKFFRQPFLGLSMFPAELSELGKTDPLPATHAELVGTVDLGWMLYDSHIDGLTGPRFFRPIMTDGVIDLRRRESLILAG